MISNKAFETDVVFKLGELYDVTVHLITSEEENDHDIIESAMTLILCDIGVDIRRIYEELNRVSFDKQCVTIKRTNYNEEDYEVITCAGCERTIKKIKHVQKRFCSSCADEIFNH